MERGYSTPSCPCCIKSQPVVSPAANIWPEAGTRDWASNHISMGVPCRSHSQTLLPPIRRYLLQYLPSINAFPVFTRSSGTQEENSTFKIY